MKVRSFFALVRRNRERAYIGHSTADGVMVEKRVINGNTGHTAVILFPEPESYWIGIGPCESAVSI